MWHPSALNLFLLPLYVQCYLLKEDCKWKVVVNRFSAIGSGRNIFLTQNEIRKVAKIFQELKDSAIDPDDRNAHYFGFPYYLKMSLNCVKQNSARAIRMLHYTGLTPIVTVTFQEPVHSVRQKREQLQIAMKAAPYRTGGKCDSEEVCDMSWITPMPMMNGSVVMEVLVKSNGLGVLMEEDRFSINVNGFAKVDREKKEVIFTIGTKLTNLKEFLSLNEVSRPLWTTFRHSPVVIIGGVPNNKIILMSDTFFDDFFPIEVAIDSCWIGSLSCPQKNFSSSILDAISTESTLFIRQNQLVYYFTGRYDSLYMETSGSELWTRILNNICVKKLNPVHFSVNDTEYVIAIGGGWQEGEFFLIRVKDGIVKVSHSMKSKNGTVCDFFQFQKCSILWIVFVTTHNQFILLVKDEIRHLYYIVLYNQAQRTFKMLYQLPKFVPRGSDKGFVMLLGTEQYTNQTLVPRGLTFNPFSMILYIWGNVILHSHDLVDYVYLSSFPSTSFIKYFVHSYVGQYACVTDNEEIWVSLEGSSYLIRIYPSEPWKLHKYLQIIGKSLDYEDKEATISVFYDREGLQQLLYLEDKKGNAKVIKRPVPLHYVLTYRHLTDVPYHQLTYQGKEYIRFTHRCPFAVLRIVDQPFPQAFTRMEHYRAEAPDVMDPTGFHNLNSLAVYQGLIFQLLWLHSAYNRPYADPVHDPTWRWWKNKKQDAEYYFYVAGNRNSSGGVYVDMADYDKVYKLKPNNVLPPQIYLDKNNTYTFFVFLSIRTTKQSLGETAAENSLNFVWLTLILSHAKFFIAKLRRQELISRGSVLYEVTLTDTGMFPHQDLSGKNLLKGSIILKVAHSSLNCYHYTSKGPRIKGNSVMGVNIGCPPGKRLAFDITGTMQYITKKNKRYFDCVNPDPEMPCFFFSDVFRPLFLIQDMVTGHSGPFQGGYVFKVIGGGPFSQKAIRYFSDEEILRYNSVHGSKTQSLIWLKENLDNKTDSEGFHILSEASSGIMFVCQKNSACYDIVPKDMSAPDYFFLVKVSNRGVDQTTYCDYALEFIIHIHGLRLSPTRAIFLMKVSLVSVIGMVFAYMFIRIVGPSIKNYFHSLYKKVEEAIVFRAESSLTFTSSFTSQSSLSNLRSPSDSSNQTSPRSLHAENL
ncbi:cation channel sperm-associated auxiliary subunit gamma-like [Eublepharis macularius]|uniref:Cation channel sperm-associated auxiliary subunit gamma-like n=1 Tax=Eublepharis macularius TaxID=481883 RepID=A0AA97KGI7_EUBMA|nr:cation channel sperm-associated auxiliary subunit gamma-like [Eublepharis macularius]